LPRELWRRFLSWQRISFLYSPDGQGVYFNNIQVEADDAVIANDELVLRLVKELKG
jgi:hypothetical protein